MSQILPGGEPFLFRGGPVGCLLIHGFTGAPREMRPLGEHLAAQGFSVVGVRLFGHATRPEDLFRARWRDWVASVEDGYALLQGLSDRIVVQGLSLGSVLALYFASRFPVRGVVAMSTPYVIPPPWARYLRPILPLLSLVLPYLGKGTPDWHDPQAAIGHLEYPKHVVRGGAEVMDVHAQMLRALPDITAPALLMASKGDFTTPPWHTQAVYDRLGSTDKQMLIVENSGHVITCDAERQRVFEAASAFVQRVTAGPA